ncbi:MAG: Rod shape-determining protein RodA [Parcubacteria group bacterium GW2011_GWA2_49_9]|nr:MAG: Rod shape-determining protein RodA [Parcubacteria group bacterium GW2011_GWA2_49_9]
MSLAKHISTATTPRSIDWILFLAVLPIVAAGLVTMYSFEKQVPVPCEEQEVATAETLPVTICTTQAPASANPYFSKQLVWLLLSCAAFFAGSFIDWRFLRRSDVLFGLFLGGCLLLLILFLLGTTRGIHGWLNFGLFSVQPVEPVKLILILVLAKYFSRRHIEIAHIRHILVSGIYAFILFVLVLLQPDFGGALVIACLWFGMVMLSGISKKHLMTVALIGAISGLFLWSFVFKDYQKQRLVTFLHPLTDIRGSGYNAYQSMIAVGSGELFGKGVGYGTQSRLQFLPEYETDFVFAAFAEEWGFMGVIVIFICYGVIIWRILRNALHGLSNFEILYGLGLAILIMSQFLIHIGMNIGLLPVTGITLPFMSYGGTNMLVLFAGFGILMGMRRYRRTAHKEEMQNEFVGVTTE